MQTFLPYADFEQSAQVLDRLRLGKQRVECKQILRAMYDRTSAWTNHPAVRMWRGHGAGLIVYYTAIVNEWQRRGYQHNMELDRQYMLQAAFEPKTPPWLGNYEFHLSHRVSLLRKNREHYFTMFQAGELISAHITNMPYIWPVDKDGRCTSPALSVSPDSMLPF